MPDPILLPQQMRCKYAFVFAVTSCIIAGLISILAGMEYSERVDPIIEIASAYFNEGNRLYQEGDNNAAISMYQESLKLHAAFPFAWSNVGVALEMEGNADGALLAYTGAVHVYPSRARNYLHIARLAHKDALVLLKQAVHLSPLLVEAQYALARLYITMNNISVALSSLQHIQTLQPTHLQSKLDYCALLYSKQNPSVALSCFKEAALLNNESEALRVHLAHIYLRSYTANAAPATTATTTPAAAAVDTYLQKAIVSFSSVRSLNSAEPLSSTYLSILAASATTDASLSTPFLRAAFNSFNIYYDPLTYTSSYTTPAQLLHHLHRYITPNTRFLDLGSGLGHTCKTIRMSLDAKHDVSIIGVDISLNMILMAQYRYPNCYNELMHRDAVEFMLEYAEYQFDIIYAADTFAYVYDLEAWFAALVDLMQHKALFAFNVDHTDVSDVFLQRTGRYAHSQEYIAQLCDKYGFTVVVSSVYEGSHVDGAIRLFRMYVLQLHGERGL